MSNFSDSLRKNSAVNTTITAEIENKLRRMDTLNGQIRYLHTEGYSVGSISKILGVSYQRVYNPISNPPKRDR